MMVTIQEVADHAGVSRSTVSRVINGYVHVKSDVRERVLKSISELNYRPNKLARSLRKQESNSIGVIVRQQKTPFSSELGYSIESVLFEHGYHSLLCSTDGDYDKESKYIDMLIDYQVGGVILRPNAPFDQSIKSIEKLLENDIPVVVLDIEIPNARVSQILSHNHNGGYKGAKYLLELGHRHIAVIASEVDQSPSLKSGSLRIRGIQQAFLDFPEPVEPIMQFSEEISRFDDGYLSAKEIFQTHPEVTAIFALTDMIAIGAMHAAEEFDLSIPYDISMLGYDGVPVSAYVIPQLSTIVQPIKEMGKIAAHTLLEHIKKDATSVRSVMLENQLAIRGSTMPPHTQV